MNNTSIVPCKKTVITQRDIILRSVCHMLDGGVVLTTNQPRTHSKQQPFTKSKCASWSRRLGPRSNKKHSSVRASSVRDDCFMGGCCDIFVFYSTMHACACTLHSSDGKLTLLDEPTCSIHTNTPVLQKPTDGWSRDQSTQVGTHKINSIIMTGDLSLQQRPFHSDDVKQKKQ